MARFLEGFRKGLKQGSYRTAALPSLDFADGGFDLTFCSDLLFLYSGTHSMAFHLDAIREMCRVAGEARGSAFRGA